MPAKIPEHAPSHTPTDAREPCLVEIAAASSAVLQASLEPARAQSQDGTGEQIILHLQRRGGRSCEGCARTLERRLAQVDGIQQAQASYHSCTLALSYDPARLNSEQILQRLESFGAQIVTPAASEPARLQLNSDQQQRLLTIVAFLGTLGGWLAEQFIGAQPAILLYALATLSGGAFGLKACLESLRDRTIDIDLLMVLAAAGAWLVGEPFEGALLLFLFSLSNSLQSYALGRTRQAIRSLMDLRPAQALVRIGQEQRTLPVEALRPGDIVIVRPGERVPIDGTVLEGHSALDQSALTGESIPVEKQAGDSVLAGSVNGNGGLELRAERLAQDTTLARMIRLVEEAQSEKAKTQRFIDRFEQRYALFVILGTAALVAVPTLFMGQSFDPVFYRAMTAMVAASPCALVISTPATVLSAIGNGARRGVLFKGGAHLERAAGIRVVAFDKTGTLTFGRPQLTDLIPAEGIREEELLACAAAVEGRSEHPLAAAITSAAAERGLDLRPVTDFQSTAGRGVQARLDAAQVWVGKADYLHAESGLACSELRATADQLQEDGKTVVYVARKTAGKAQALGLLAVADELRPAAPDVIARLKKLGIQRVVMLTGDHALAAQAIGRRAGVDEVRAGLLPQEKLAAVREIGERYGPLLMVGDGVNDAPALAAASMGAAMGAAGTDVALETADVVLMADDLWGIPYLIALSRAARRTLMINLAFSMGMIALMLAAIFGLGLPLPLVVVGHEGGTVLVSLNGLRLLFYKTGA